MKYKAALFDMDGTVLDTLDDLHAAVNVALARFGYPPRTRDEVRRFIGNGVRRLMERAVPAGTDEARIAAVLDGYRTYYEQHAENLTRPYPGLLDALHSLRAAGVRLAVVTNKPDGAAQRLSARYFPGLFDETVGIREGVAVKPAPDAVFAVLERMGVAPEDAVYIGDSDTDIETARNAGTACIAAAWGYRGEEFLRAHGADTVARACGELVPLILGSSKCANGRAD